jgi:GAF domain-containing protein
MSLPLIIPQFPTRDQSPEQLESAFAMLLPVLGDLLGCDRCFLYLRNPDTKLGKVTHCWRRSDRIPNLIDLDWKPEPESLVQEDPMFAAAVRAEPSIFVDDVETASLQVLNRSFEEQNFGHRALIHAHLRQDNELWGIFQPCLFDQSRTWTTDDRTLITEVEQKLTPLAIAYVKSMT